MIAASVPLLDVSGLVVSTNARSRIDLVRGVSFSILPGEVMGVVGESGSGKTMTALGLVGLLPPAVALTGGSIRFRGEEIGHAGDRRLSEIRGKQVSFVFQDPTVSLNPLMRIGKQVVEALRLHGAPHGADLAVRALAEVGVAAPRENSRAYPHEFSGGMRQRAMIAGALIAAPDLIIADEPTTALDVTVQAQILDLCRTLNRERGVAILLISHDLGVVSEFCDSIAVMYAGRIVEVGRVRDVLHEASHPYTRALIDSMPGSLTRSGMRLNAISGEPPSFAALPPGCPFHRRCKYAMDICRRTEPDLLDVGRVASACWVAQAGGLPTLAAAPPTVPKSAVPLQAEPEAISVADTSLLRVENLHFSYPLPSATVFGRGRRVHAIDGVSIEVNRGDILGIVGESGCGKSTLARCILRLVKADSGTITFAGQNLGSLEGEALRRLRPRIQPVFQDPHSALNPGWSVAEIVAEPLTAQGLRGPEVSRRVELMLDQVGLGRRNQTRRPFELSGGQKQRVGIARALVTRPDLVIADEPLSSLDVSIQAQIVNLLFDLQDELKLSMIFISHDLRVVRHLCTKIAVMLLGRIVETGDTETICCRPSHPYTAALLSAVPQLPGGTEVHGGRIVLQGDPPSPLFPPAGCAFHTRCSYAAPICATDKPVLEGAFAQQAACHFPLGARHGP